jgi:pimeloyl-ACP methyl ester carboxylesterase
MNHFIMATCLLAVGCALDISHSYGAYTLEIRELTTPSGVRFSVVGGKPTKPAPTIFLFGATASDALRAESVGRIGRLLERDGFLSVSVDLPEHGAEMREEAPAMRGWAQRLSKGDNWLPAYMTKLSGVLDYLIGEGYTDPTTVVAVGVSRGGFIALHFAAAEPRVRCVMGIGPVTDLRLLMEFDGLDDNELVKSVSVTQLAPKLVGRPVFVCIGNHDLRVGTPGAIEFTNAVVAESAPLNTDKRPEELPPINIQLNIMPWPGHVCPDASHDLAYEWLHEQLRTQTPAPHPK